MATAASSIVSKKRLDWRAMVFLIVAALVALFFLLGSAEQWEGGRPA